MSGCPSKKQKNLHLHSPLRSKNVGLFSFFRDFFPFSELFEIILKYPTNCKKAKTSQKSKRFQVASLSFVERCAAKMVGQVPDVSYQNALDDLLKADQLMQGVAENQLFIGKTFLAMGNLAKAKKWLMKVE